MKDLGFYKIDIRAKIPAYATPGAACFDFHCLLSEGTDFVYLFAGTNLILGCGLIPVIPEGYSLRIHPRSGLAFKNNITLVNCEGIIDNDYADEIKFNLIKFDDNFEQINEPLKICCGDRIAQGELVKNESTCLREIYERPSYKWNRKGGFGSTGK